MYFVYQKSINVASKYSYDVESIIEWFQNYIDGDYIKTVYDKDITARDIVYDIFYNNLIFNYISQYHFMPLVNIQEYT